MKVCLVTTSFPLSGQSTSGVFVARLADELAKYVSLTVIAPAGENSISGTQYDSFKVVVCHYAPKSWRRLTHRPGGIPAALKSNPLLYFVLPFLLACLFYSCLKNRKTTDLFHANWSVTGIVAGLAAKLAGKPCVTTLRGSDVNRALNSLVYKLILKLCLRLTTQVIAVSEGIRDNIHTLFPLYKDSVVIIPNGVDSRFSEVAPDSTPHNTVNLVCVGNLTTNKSTDTIIRAVGLLQTQLNIHLTIVGDGPQRANLRELVNELGLSQCVTFTGTLPHEKVLTVLTQSDIFVHASQSEGRPNVVLEAMAAGLPVVATQINGIMEIIDHERNGLLFKPRDPADLAQKINLLVARSSLKKSLIDNAKKFIIQNNLSWEAAANRYCQIYTDLVQRA